MVEFSSLIESVRMCPGDILYFSYNSYVLCMRRDDVICDLGGCGDFDDDLEVSRSTDQNRSSYLVTSYLVHCVGVVTCYR